MTVSPMAPVATPTGRGAQARARILARTETRLDALLAAERAQWAGVDARAIAPVESVGQLVRAGGKRLRPAFCAAGFLAAGGEETDTRVVEAAAAVELLHAFALIHDDVIDDSPLRRGEPTAHVRAIEQHRALGWHGEARRYGEGVAVLAGDLALSYAMRLAQELPATARGVWGELVTEMIVGQHLDVAVAAEGVADTRLSEYIANAKSGRYSIRRPLELGAAITGNTTLAATFEAYGAALGEAFQLRDDLIDAFGDADVAGKPVGADAENNKMTLLMSLAVGRSERVRDLVSAGGRDETALRAEIAAIDVRAEVERRIDTLVDQAREALANAPLPQEWREELAGMAVAVAYRDK
ncbi:polyprenyl synthetase family protein [Streptomyces sp. 71268]|uniref:polyprenyl synthetase family protein n=1 Tax=Streptomyces sp. 71268 TaxID=3002640 RepID=UPI0023F832CA|nr:polyprenyl synthetase family protein [Streptomyces sp. 71268]WEV29478.1 polyprenyl synthetase family protein [Streptomyces sp. 71268]